MADQTFAFADYIVFCLTVGVSVSIGIYFAVVGRKHQTTLNFFLGDRQLQYGPVALSLVVTFQSSVMLLGFPAEVYLFGFMICLFSVGQCAAIYVSTCIVVPLFYPLKITSMYHYLRLRFGNNRVRLLSVTIGILSQAIYMGSVLFGPAIALESVTEIPVWVSIISISGAAVVYTSIGGILAVVWTDVLQCVIINAGIIAVLIKGTMAAGGAAAVFRENYQSARFDIFDFNPDPRIRHSFWTLMIGSFVGSFSLTLSQSAIQRFNATPKLQDAKKVFFIAGPVFAVMQTMSMAVGLVCYTYYVSQGCDPLRSKRIQNPNQIVPYMTVEIFKDYPGLSGLFISALFSASLSTLSSLLAGLSAITVEDLVRPYFTLSDLALTRVAKLAVVFYGVLGICVAFIISQLEGSLTQILFGIMGAATGPSVGILFLSMFCRKATDIGVITGGLVGLVFSFWICVGATIHSAVLRPVPLPLPPTDMCYLHTSGMNGTYNITTSPDMLTTYTISNITTTILNITEQVKTAAEPKGLEGIDRIYTVSYALYATIGTLVTVLIGVVISLLTYSKERDSVVDDRLLMMPERFVPMCFRWKRQSEVGVNLEERSPVDHDKDEEADCAEPLRQHLA